MAGTTTNTSTPGTATPGTSTPGTATTNTATPGTATPGTISAVVFDFGGVLSTSPRVLMSQRAAAAGITLEQLMSITLGPFDEDTDHPWHRTERGELTIEEFNEAIEPQWRAMGVTGTLPSPPSADELFAHLTAVPEMIDAARSIRAAGITTAILSNNVREWAVWRDVVDADDLVDVVIDSCDVGLRKPSPAIYQLLLDEIATPPDACLFLDDFPWNTAGAAALGINTMLVEDPAASAAALLAQLGLPA